MFARFLKAALALGIFFGVTMGIVFGLLDGWKVGLIIGGASGAFFGLIVGAAFTAFYAYQKRKAVQMPLELETGEKILREGAANRLVNRIGVGGWLYLTNRKLVFRPHKFNFQVHEISLPLAKIAATAPAQAMGIFPTGLNITLKDKTTEKFVVESRSEWREQISRAMSKPKKR